MFTTHASCRHALSCVKRIRETLLFLAVSVSDASLWRRYDRGVVGTRGWSRGRTAVFISGSEDRFRSHERRPSPIFDDHLYSWHCGVVLFGDNRTKKKTARNCNEPGMDDLWTIETIDEGDVETFEDSLGESLVERMQPLPPPDMREHGLSASALHLDAHTGARRWAHAGDDVPREDMFDTDRMRAADRFSSATSARLVPQVQRVQNGVQQASEMETTRRDMYNGYNERLARVARGLTDTRRGITPLDVTGHETSGSFTQGPLRASRATGVGKLALGHGQYDSTQSHTMASRSDVGAKGWVSLMQMGAHGVSAVRSAGVRYAGGGDGNAMPTHIVSHTKRGLVDTPHTAQRSTRNDTITGAPRGDVSLSKYDSTTSLRRGVTDNSHESRRGLPSSVALGSADSVSTAEPRRVTFDEVAAFISAQVPLGTRDSTGTIGWDVQRRNDVTKSIVPTQETTLNGRETISAPMSRSIHETEYTRALESLRARDAKTDSVRTERMVADQVNAFHATIVADHARKQRDTASLNTNRNTRKQSTHQRRGVEGGMKLGEDATTFVDDHRGTIGGDARARPVYTSNVPLSEYDAQWRREGIATSNARQMPVQSAAARELRDDGHIYASHEPLTAGPERLGVVGGIERATREMLHITPTVRMSAMNNPQRPPQATLQQRGTRR